MDEYDDIIKYLYNKKESDRLIEQDSKALEDQREKADNLEKQLNKFIAQRIHPKSRKRLIELIENHAYELMGSMCIEKELAYKNGFSDAMKMVLLSLVNKL